MKKLSIFSFLTLFFSLSLIAQTQKSSLRGVIVDNANNETLIGASVLIEGTNIGAISDIDGNYELRVEPGTYNLVFSYIGMQKQTSKGIRVDAGQTVTVDMRLAEESGLLAEVVITTAVQKKSVGALVLLQQKSPSFITGITGDEMRKSPDRTTGDVLKRVSGTAIQDNKFVVIRGLSDRYNTALINGLALPSTEPDRKAFAFDLFPSNLLDNLIIYKTATPDLPGEFAGGTILLNTKEVPEENFTTFSISSGYNQQTTFKDFKYSERGKLDWLGIDDGTRKLPAAFPSLLEDDEEAFAYSKTIANDWKILAKNAMRPAQSYQLSLARHYNIKGRELGMIGALTYNNAPRVQFNERNDYAIDKSEAFAYDDVIYKTNTSTGALLNFSMNINPLNKIQFNNVYSLTNDDQFIERKGVFELSTYQQSYAYYYVGTNLLSTQVIGEHALPEGKMKVKWAYGHSEINRSTPSYRRMLYSRSVETPDAVLQAYVPVGSPSPNFSGRFYGDQNEKSHTANVDVTIPYKTKGLRNNFKFGGVVDFKDREFEARVLGYVGNAPEEILQTPIDKIFASENIKPGVFKLRESTDKSDAFTANSTLGAAYGMFEQQLSSKLRFVGGVRFESYNQQLSSYVIKSNTPVNVDTTFNDFMPSANLTYSMNEKSNLRFSLSKTVARPNFREIAPFAFYDFLLNAGINGNPNLVRTNIVNADVKYEIFPGLNQTFSVSAFYKHFKNPIEQVPGFGSRNLLFQNSASAQNFGAEAEMRFKLDKFKNVWKQAENFTFFSNIAYIYSEVDLSDQPGATRRGLQGQSPYILNVGLGYNNIDKGFGATVLFNQIGRRIWVVDQEQYKRIYEAPRGVLDFQVTKKVWKKGELKLNVNDILNQEQVFYQDQDDNGRFNQSQDTKIISSKFGRNVSLGFSYTF